MEVIKNFVTLPFSHTSQKDSAMILWGIPIWVSEFSSIDSCKELTLDLLKSLKLVPENLYIEDAELFKVVGSSSSPSSSMLCLTLPTFDFDALDLHQLAINVVSQRNQITNLYSLIKNIGSQKKSSRSNEARLFKRASAVRKARMEKARLCYTQMLSNNSEEKLDVFIKRTGIAKRKHAVKLQAKKIELEDLKTESSDESKVDTKSLISSRSKEKRRVFQDQNTDHNEMTKVAISGKFTGLYENDVRHSSFRDTVSKNLLSKVAESTFTPSLSDTSSSPGKRPLSKTCEKPITPTNKKSTLEREKFVINHSVKPSNVKAKKKSAEVRGASNSLLLKKDLKNRLKKSTRAATAADLKTKKRQKVPLKVKELTSFSATSSNTNISKPQKTIPRVPQTENSDLKGLTLNLKSCSNSQTAILGIKPLYLGTPGVLNTHRILYNSAVLSNRTEKLTEPIGRTFCANPGTSLADTSLYLNRAVNLENQMTASTLSRAASERSVDMSQELTSTSESKTTSTPPVPCRPIGRSFVPLLNLQQLESKAVTENLANHYKNAVATRVLTNSNTQQASTQSSLQDTTRKVLPWLSLSRLNSVNALRNKKKTILCMPAENNVQDPEYSKNHHVIQNLEQASPTTTLYSKDCGNYLFSKAQVQTKIPRLQQIQPSLRGQIQYGCFLPTATPLTRIKPLTHYSSYQPITGRLTKQNLNSSSHLSNNKLKLDAVNVVSSSLSQPSAVNQKATPPCLNSEEGPKEQTPFKGTKASYRGASVLQKMQYKSNAPNLTAVQRKDLQQKYHTSTEHYKHLQPHNSFTRSPGRQGVSSSMNPIVHSVKSSIQYSLYNQQNVYNLPVKLY